MDNTNKQFWERITPHHAQVSTLLQVLYSGRTKYQSVEIINTGSFGLTLVLDGKSQSSIHDEHIYHEALVHPVMVLHPNPRRVFIAGGGEGATLREVLAHKFVQRVLMVDIDSELVELCKTYLPSFSDGAFDDPRVELQHEDARAYLEDSREGFDVIIIDIPDPLEGGPAHLLYTQDFYKLLRRRLNSQGIIAVQAGPTAIGDVQCFSMVQHTLSSVFPQSSGYHTYMASFGTTWGFVLAGSFGGPAKLTAQEVDSCVEQRVGHPLKFYDGITHQGLFALPPYLRAALASETRIITEQDPLFVT